MADPRAIIERSLDAIDSIDFAAAAALLGDDFLPEYPQSREVIRGPLNLRPSFENYPGGFKEGDVDRGSTKVVGGDQVGDDPVVRARSCGWYGRRAHSDPQETLPGRIDLVDPPEWRAKWIEPREPR